MYKTLTGSRRKMYKNYLTTTYYMVTIEYGEKTIRFDSK